MLKYKMINYIGDYGTANFWSNILPQEIDNDLAFISEQGFNTLILMIPYSAFKPNMNNFENKYHKTLNYILKVAKNHKLEVVFRIGYLWESTFAEDRTLERYIDIYAQWKNGGRSQFEDDLIGFINHYYENYEFLHMMISWEDFFLPIAFYNSTGNNDNQENERELIRFMEYLLGRVGHKDKLYVEQRTNGDFDKIIYNPTVSYAYYNTYNIQSWDDDVIGLCLGRGHLISESMLVPKQYIEWYSRLKEKLDLGSQNKLIIDQFNIVDNTFSDDDEHESFHKSKRKLSVAEDNLPEIMEFLTPVLKNTLYGIGFWSLWSTYAGQIYNGNFKFGPEGWETDGYINNNSLLLESGKKIYANLAYIRLEYNKPWHLLMNYSAIKNSMVKIKFNGKVQNIKLDQVQNEKLVLNYNIIKDKYLEIECVSGELKIYRMDIFSIMHKSILFDEKRRKNYGYESFQELLA